eukprot:PhM_4_TR16154/c1_g1_i1/m.43343/K06670/SCC1, MCD1, RAD21; cohesin complex subunit SCC1
MFFHTYILTKRGPFAKIWLAAHWDRRLTKHDVKVIDLSQTVVQIVEPTVPIALRTSGELMLGVVRVYGHKVRFLLKEAQDVTHELLRPLTLKEAAGGVGKGATGEHALLSLSGGPATGVKGGAKDNAAHVTLPDAAPKDLLASGAGGAGALEGEFDAIAGFVLGGDAQDDFMLPVGGMLSTVKKGSKHPGDDGMADEWFQPQTSQFQEGLRALSQEEFDMLRAEFGGSGKRTREESVPLSERSKKSGTASSTSVEQLRASGRNTRGGAEVDLLMDLPNVGPEGFADPLDGVAPLDPLRGPSADGELPAQQQQPGLFDDLDAGAPLDRPPKRVKTLALVDAASTTIPTTTYQNAMRSEADLGPRRPGPRTSADAHRLQHMADPAPLDLLGAVSADDTPWARMRETYAATVRSGRGAPWEAEAEAPRRDSAAPGGADLLPDMMMPPGGDFDAQGMMPPALPEGEEAPHADAHVSPARTKEHLDQTLSLLKGNANTKGVAVFRTMMKGKKRIDAARAFADVLVMASLGNLDVRQDKPFGELYVTVKS